MGTIAMQMLRALVTGCIGLFFAIGCAPSSHPDPNPPAPGPATRAAAVGDVDQQVIEAALADLLTLNKSPVAMRDAPPAELRFSDQPPTEPLTTARVLMRHDKAQWQALSDAQLDAASQAATEVVRRHQSKETFKPFQPTDPRVKVQPLSRATTMGSIYERPIQAWSPGYSSDHQYAVVFLTIPWSMHHADATYLLAREGSAWRIVLRQFVYYV